MSDAKGTSSPGGRIRFEADAVLVDGDFRRDTAILVDDGGRIVAVGEEAETGRAETVRRYAGAIVPGAVNAHSHAFQILLRGISDGARDFRDWVDNYLYELGLAIDGEEIALGSELAFAEMLKNGVTTVGEFFYLHNAPAADDCVRRGNRNAERVIDAAGRVGIRIHLLRCLYDRAEKEGQRRFFEPADEAVAATTALEEATRDDDRVTVAIAPHSLHGATAEGIRAAAAWAEERERPFQIHVAEERHDLDFSRELYGTTPGRALEELGVVSDRLCVVHGVWLDGEEIEMLGEAGAGCAYNPISNMALGDGITDVPAMIGAGMTVGLGCDGPCANHQVNIWQEMRFAEWLQRVRRLEMNVIPRTARRAGVACTRNYCFEMGTDNGGRVLGLPIGRLVPGRWADFAVIDTTDPSLLPHQDDDPATLLHNLIHAMAARGAVTHVVVAGEEVVADGRLTRIDEEELRRRASGWIWPGRPSGDSPGGSPGG